ncbi:hypothetical protein [Nocardioides dongkuii]|uniref:hypothetical protein n=1 Tax=Nocardioides dongkuii TaxID=2760089 RepID=UPI0015FC14B9|nr:hypothetical protein [Nocardioides dongkuii]
MSNKIHPTAIIEGDVGLGDDNEIGPYCVLLGPLTIGDRNQIHPHVVIGTPGEDTRDPRHDASDKPITIGNGNIIREFTTIQKPCYGPVTSLADDVFLMHGVHVPHDAILHDGVVVTPLCVLGGIVTILRHATIGMGATLHQYSVVGHYSMTATGAAAMKNIRPFSRYIPGQPISVNRYPIEKFGFEHLEDQITEYVLSDTTPEDADLRAMVAEYRQLHEASGRREYS